MGTFNSNIIPTATGLDLGTAAQQWDLEAQNVTVHGTLTANTVSGTMAIANAGVFTDTQQNDYATSIVNSLNISSEYSAAAGGHKATEALVGAVAVPNTATVWQANGVAGYVTNASTTTQAVGVFGNARAAASGAAAIGANFVASGTSGIGNAKLASAEFDFNPENTTDTGSAVAIIYGTVVQSTAANALVISTQQPGVTAWNAGLVLSTAATTGGSASPGISLQPVASGASQASQAINFVAKDGSNVSKQGTLDLSLAGALRVTNATSVTATSPINSTSIGSGTASGIATVAAGQASLAVKDTTQAANAKLWDVLAGLDANTLRFRAVNDAENSAITWLKATRNATTTVALDLTGSASIALPTTTSNSSILSSSSTAGVGYATGAGSTIGQATNKSTGVAINALSGTITMNNANLGATTSVGFTVTNTAVAATDVIIMNIKSGATADSYTVTVDAVVASSFRISLRNYTAGGLAEAVVLSFAVIKAVAA